MRQFVQEYTKYWDSVTKKVDEALKVASDASGTVDMKSEEKKVPVVVRLFNFIDADIVEDEEIAEVLDSAKELFAPFGGASSITVVPQADGLCIEATLPSRADAERSVEALNGRVFGGTPIEVRVTDSAAITDNRSSAGSNGDVDSVQSFEIIKAHDVSNISRTPVVYLENLVFPEDVADADEAAEVMQDIQSLCSPFNPINIWLERIESTDLRSLSFHRGLQHFQPSSSPSVLAWFASLADAVVVSSSIMKNELCRNNGISALLCQSHGSSAMGSSLVQSISFGRLCEPNRGVLYAVRIRSFVDAEEIEDEDESSEIINDLKNVFSDHSAGCAVVFASDRDTASLDTLILFWNDIEAVLSVYHSLLGKIYAGNELHLSVISISEDVLINVPMDELVGISSCNGRRVEYHSEKADDLSKYFDISSQNEMSTESNQVCIALGGLDIDTSLLKGLIEGPADQITDDWSDSKSFISNDIIGETRRHKENLVLLLQSLSPSEIPRIRELCFPSSHTANAHTSSIVVGISVQDYECGVKALLHMEGSVIGGNAIAASLTAPAAWDTNENKKPEPEVPSAQIISNAQTRSESTPTSTSNDGKVLSKLSAASAEFVPSFLRSSDKSAPTTKTVDEPPSPPLLLPEVAKLGSRVAQFSRGNPPRQPRAEGKLVPGVKVCIFSQYSDK